MVRVVIVVKNAGISSPDSISVTYARATPQGLTPRHVAELALVRPDVRSSAQMELAGQLPNLHREFSARLALVA